MKPIISPVYKKGVNIINSNPQLQEALEPWFNGGKDIMVKVNGNKFTQQDFQIIQKLNDIIKDSGEIGQFELGNLHITINSLKEYQNDLIKNNNKDNTIIQGYKMAAKEACSFIKKSLAVEVTGLSKEH
jgi:hypothetical protein